MSESRWVELFVQEVTNVTDNDQDQITDSLAVFGNIFVPAYLMYVVTRTKYAGFASPSGWIGSDGFH